MSTKTPTARASGASAPFRTDKATGRGLTSEQIADHLAAFRRSGGTVEVLGTTRTLRRIDGSPAAETPAPVAPARKK